MIIIFYGNNLFFISNDSLHVVEHEEVFGRGIETLFELLTRSGQDEC